MRKWAAMLVLAGCAGVAARAKSPEGIQEIVGNAFNGRTGKLIRPCAFWANDAAAAVRRREKGAPEDEATHAVDMPSSLEHPTDADSDFYARRSEIVAQVYQADQLQHLNPRQIHDAVFAECQAESK